MAFLFCIFYNIKISFSQQVINGDFEGFNSEYVSGTDCNDNTNPSYLTTGTAPFQACSSTDSHGNVINTWWVSHGTPEIYELGGNHMGVMWTGEWQYDDGHFDNVVRGEGIFLYCPPYQPPIPNGPPFEVGRIYNLSLQLGANTQDIQHAYIILTYANDIPTNYLHWSYDVSDGTYDIPPIPTPPNSQTIADEFITGSTSNHYNYTFTPNQNYDVLWIFPVSDKRYPIAVLYIDNVVFGECIDNITYQYTNNLPAMTIRSDYIKTLNTVTVQSGQNVTFNAGNYIELTPGFEAEDGSIFNAKIQGCAPLNFGECAAGGLTKSSSKLADVSNIKNNPIAENISLFPNPVYNEAILSYTLHADAILHIYSLLGQELAQYKMPASGNSINFSVSDFKDGMYVYKISIEDNIIRTDKFLIIK
jgi:hypothetical protein